MTDWGVHIQLAKLSKAELLRLRSEIDDLLDACDDTNHDALADTLIAGMLFFLLHQTC
jgi:hypothetical protein